MTERDELVPVEHREAASPSRAMPTSGDPSLELFGHGWTPKGRSTDPDSYRGRHRAEDL
ncbi:hypothetical protein [Mycolicibacterium hodleri]|uniref:hypothetical protein n=1 Tax=Mycolicibacterium hodleri TaxID=49897 RepID=UPI0013757972|nr:hypothetical protein [Mycolicibacterium hodleri]